VKKWIASLGVSYKILREVTFQFKQFLQQNEGKIEQFNSIIYFSSYKIPKNQFPYGTIKSVSQ
jgi:hypothetical protein